MDTVAIKAQTRDDNKNNNQLRTEGFVPAVFYKGGKTNHKLQLNYQDFRRAYLKAGENTVIELEIDGKTENALIQETQYHPIHNKIIHVDFIGINMNEAITTHIPIEFTGEAPAVKTLGGIFTAHLHEVEVKCLPKDLIHSIEIDVSPLIDFHASLHVADLEIPETIELLTDPELTLANVSAPTVASEPETSEGAEGEEGAETAEGEGGEEKAEEGKEEAGE